jgi:hypothetical protein
LAVRRETNAPRIAPKIRRLKRALIAAFGSRFVPFNESGKDRLVKTIPLAGLIGKPDQGDRTR